MKVAFAPTHPSSGIERGSLFCSRSILPWICSGWANSLRISGPSFFRNKEVGKGSIVLPCSFPCHLLPPSSSFLRIVLGTPLPGSLTATFREQRPVPFFPLEDPLCTSFAVSAAFYNLFLPFTESDGTASSMQGFSSRRGISTILSL